MKSQRGAIDLAALAIFAVITVLIPLTVKLVRERQEIRGRAVEICGECTPGGGGCPEGYACNQNECCVPVNPPPPPPPPTPKHRECQGNRCVLVDGDLCQVPNS